MTLDNHAGSNAWFSLRMLLFAVVAIIIVVLKAYDAITHKICVHKFNKDRGIC